MAHYFDRQPQSGHKPRTIKFNMAGRDFQFQTDSGVFARTEVDYGSRLLLESVVKDLDKPYGKVLDLGCGYGVIGIVFKRLYPHLQVVMADINRRALELARGNAVLNQVKFIEIIESDGLAAIPGSFDLVLLNPPVRSGKDNIFRLYKEAMGSLVAGGSLYIVLQKKQGAVSTENYLRTLSSRVEKINRSAGYWIIKAEKDR